MSRRSYRFGVSREETRPPPDLEGVPRDYFELHREREIADDAPRPCLRPQHLPAIVFVVVLILALSDEAGRRLKALGLADDLSAGVADELHAIQTAREGMACLAGSGVCPGGRRSPF